MVYLNGKEVSESKIDPIKHKFIGAFRPSDPPRSDGTWEVYLCPCGQHLWSVDAVFDHWQLGHLDVPQYVNIDAIPPYQEMGSGTGEP